MGNTSVRYEKEKMKLIHELGYTHSEAYAAGVEAILLSELPREQLDEAELERKIVEADQTILKAAAQKTLLIHDLKEKKEARKIKEHETETLEATIKNLTDLLVTRKKSIKEQYAKLVLEYITDQDPTGKLPVGETINFIRSNPPDQQIGVYVRFKLTNKD